MVRMLMALYGNHCRDEAPATVLEWVENILQVIHNCRIELATIAVFWWVIIAGTECAFVVQLFHSPIKPTDDGCNARV